MEPIRFNRSVQCDGHPKSDYGALAPPCGKILSHWCVRLPLDITPFTTTGTSHSSAVRAIDVAASGVPKFGMRYGQPFNDGWCLQ
jgi:hypothetical protein